MRQSADAENVDPRASGSGDWPGLAAAFPHQQQQPGLFLLRPASASASASGALKVAAGAPGPAPPPQGASLAPRSRPALRDITLLMVPQAEAGAKDGMEKLGGLLAAPVVAASARAAAAPPPATASLLPPRPPRAAVASMR
jgi:hypothetical protein